MGSMQSSVHVDSDAALRGMFDLYRLNDEESQVRRQTHTEGRAVLGNFSANETLIILA